jgi:hypothetical protein
MTGSARNQNDMPGVPDMDFIGALCEIWSGLNYAAYHLAYVRVYSQTAALQTDVDQLRKQEQVLRDMTQADVVICRAHLAAFFWQLDHIFEALKIAVTRGQKEHATLKYFWSFEKRLEEIEQTAIRQEISAYRNKGHEIPAIIGCAWDKKGGKFLHHFLPSIVGHAQNESIDMNTCLQQYFEFVANVWLSFAPGDLKSKFPRSFRFPITIPHSYLGELPPELNAVPQLEVLIEAYDRVNVSTGTGEDAKQQ